MFLDIGHQNTQGDLAMEYLSTLLVMMKRALRAGHRKGRPCATLAVVAAPSLILYFLGRGPAEIWMACD